MLLKFVSFFTILACLISCGGGNEPTQNNKQSLLLTYSFAESANGFSIDTADHDVKHPSNETITSAIAPLPSPYEYRKGIMFQWHNYSDDIKGFIKKKVTGLNQNSMFLVDFRVDVLTFMSENCAGIGGMPGASVRVKSSLLIREPQKITNSESGPLMYRIDIDDGQSGGADVILLGHIGLPIACDDNFFENPIWEIKSLMNDQSFAFTTDSKGEAWIYVSIDSGFEGRSTFYLTEVELQISEL